MASILGGGGAGSDDDLLDWYPSQVKGPVDDEVQEGRWTSDNVSNRTISM